MSGTIEVSSRTPALIDVVVGGAPVTVNVVGSGLPDPWTANQTSGEVVATVDDPTKTPITIQALIGQLVALLNLVDENGATAAITGGLTPWGAIGLIAYDPTAATPFEKGWVALGTNPSQSAAGVQETDFVLTYGDGSENVTEFWCGPPGGQSGFNIVVKKTTDHTDYSELTSAVDTANVYYQARRNSGSFGSVVVGVESAVAHLKAIAAIGQTQPILDVRDSGSSSLAAVTQSVVAQNAIVVVRATGGNPIFADAGSYTVQVASVFGDTGNVVVTVGDNTATIQAAFDAIAGGEFAVVGDWSDFNVEFVGNNALTAEGDPFVITANTMTFFGDPVANPVAVTIQFGIPTTVAGQARFAGPIVSNAQTLPDVADLAIGDHGSISDPTAAAPTITHFVKDDAGNLRTLTIAIP